MASQNLFEKYGIKDVCDVTFYKIEQKEEAYESQRKITEGSILRSCLELRNVYPLDQNGVGIEEGFKAYVFEDATILSNKTYTDLEDDPETQAYDPSIETEVHHEFSYEEQVCQLFAKRQNIIKKTGVRYQFNAATMFDGFEFNDEFAADPYSKEKVVVVGLVDKFTETTYDIEEIDAAILNLKTPVTAKAYDVTYDDYAELVVEDEMGYYNPKYLGHDLVINQDGTKSITHYVPKSANSYANLVTNPDKAIANAVMWDEGVHESINDAIEALRQKQLIVDQGGENAVAGINAIEGGYRVSGDHPDAGGTDITPTNDYQFSVDGVQVDDVHSKYNLASVNDAVAEIAGLGTAQNKTLHVDLTTGTVNAESSNRAIYVKVDGAVDTDTGSYIYLLTNVNAKKLSNDTVGIFRFIDKKGNEVFYQDKIFAGTKYLALVIIGTSGLIFVVNRNGRKDLTKVAWMVTEGNFVTNNQAKELVKSGLIHTTEVTVNNETFEATCTVKDIKVHKTVKKVKRYKPVLFLDTLKVSTLSTTAQEVFATGGHGNAQLMGWDFGKEITLTLQDALFTPASMAAMFGTDGSEFAKANKPVKKLDRTTKQTAARNFIVPGGNANGFPSEADMVACTVFIDPATMEPYADGTPIAEGEEFIKFTRSVAYDGESLGNMIEISADKFPGTYKVVGDTYIKSKSTGEEQRFQINIPEAKLGGEQTLTLQADGDPAVFDMELKVLRPDDKVMVRLIQYDVVDNEEQNDGSTMVKDTENLDILDDAELFKTSLDGEVDKDAIGATEY